MSSKNVLKTVTVLSAGDASTASLTSSVTNVQFLDDISYQAIWTGTPTGTLKIQASLNNTDWFDLANTFTSVPAGSASNSGVNLPTIAYPYLRAVYTKTSGTGALTFLICAKGL
jgi:hypothetical protein